MYKSLHMHFYFDFVRQVYAPQFFVSSQQKVGETDIEAPSVGHSSWVLDRPVLQLLNKSVLQLSVTALFYLDGSWKTHLRGVRARRSKDGKRRAPHRAGERERRELWFFFFICFSVPGPVLCKLGQPGVLFVLPEVLTQVFGPSFVLFSWAFPFLVFQSLPFWTPFPYSNNLIIW